ncbi:MAG: Rpn family recombination-promoting nuclease/putative transposase, partial [Dysgonamonadaceae bacterium]|nr:Rpn family recombination-promoting nuclease/putative transposase [Dysgonamonadaceae bacterium]
GLEFVFVELQKFKPENRAEQKLHNQWLRFLTEINEHTEKAPQELLAQPEIQEAVHYMEIGAFSKAELAAYDREKDAVMSARTLISDAKREGLEIGEEIGLAKGRNEREIEIARNLLSLGVSVENIAKSTGLPVEQISRYC